MCNLPPSPPTLPNTPSPPANLDSHAGYNSVDFICPEERPWPIFTSFAWTLNLIPSTIGIVIAIGGSDKCDSNLRTYLIVQFFVCCLHLCFATYGYYRVANPAPGNENKSLASLAWHMAMYDPGVCLYGAVWIGALVWNVIGSGYVSSASTECESEAIYKMAAAMVVIMYLYLFGGFAVLFMSIFCDCCREERPRKETNSRSSRNRDPEAGRSSRSSRGAVASSGGASGAGNNGGGGGGFFSGVKNLLPHSSSNNNSSAAPASRSSSSAPPPAYQPASASPYQQSAAANTAGSGGYRQASY